MSVVPQGKAVQAMYRDHREGNLLVNRKYQRKLVWELAEKQAPIGSILKGYPIPLILLAERSDIHGAGKYEIIDGIQRLNAIFTFVEQSFDVEGHYFDVGQFATARQASIDGAFTIKEGLPVFSARDCARILDYQLAITIYPTADEASITDLFGRINSGGRQLSPQEQRQAGVTSKFSNLVRSVSAELRGDVSQDILLLTQMPEISIESGREVHGYGVQAEDTLWCRQGILSVKQLRQSEDEQFIADLAASIVRQRPLGVSRELLDQLYDQGSEDSQELEREVIAYGIERLAREIKFTFSIVMQVVEDCCADRNFLRSTVRPGGGGLYPIKAPFYAIFMAFFDLVVREQKSPIDPHGIIGALRGLAARLQKGAHYETSENRLHNINLTKGLIREHFAARVPPAFGHGPALVLDLENAIRRSKIESSRYEFKQGILRLDQSRQLDIDLLERLVETTCGIANIGPDSDGNLFIGIANSKQDSDRIAVLDGVSPHRVGGHFLVGIEREALILGVSLDEYVQRVVAKFQASDLSEPLKIQILGSFDAITVHGLTVLRIRVPKQNAMSFVGNRAFDRHGSSTVEVTRQQLVAVSKRFPVM